MIAQMVKMKAVKKANVHLAVKIIVMNMHLIVMLKVQIMIQFIVEKERHTTV